MKNVAGGSGKWLDVSAARFPGWIGSFGIRHGVHGTGGTARGVPGEHLLSVTHSDEIAVTVAADHVLFTAPDGSAAACYPPFPPATGIGALLSTAGDAMPGGAMAAAEAIAAHAARPRTVGVLLVRLGGYAAGVFTGYPPALADAKTGSRPVHGRSAAGGWSQHRFARRREKQANEALQAAADAAVLIFGRVGQKITATSGGAAAPGAAAPGTPRAGLDAVVLGGDKRAIAELRDDPRLAPYFALATDRFLTVPDPRRAVLLDSPRLFGAIRIWLTEATEATEATETTPPDSGGLLNTGTRAPSGILDERDRSQWH